MADSNSQIDILNHLLEVEKDVSILVEQAVADAEKKVSEAKVTANAMFQEKNALAQTELENDFQQQLQAVKNNREKKIQDFTNNLHNRPLHSNALNACLDALLIKK